MYDIGHFPKFRLSNLKFYGICSGIPFFLHGIYSYYRYTILVNDLNNKYSTYYYSIIKNLEAN